MSLCKLKSATHLLLCLRNASLCTTGTICTYLHIPEAGSCPGAFPAGLWQRRVRGYSCPPTARLQSVLNAAARAEIKILVRSASDRTLTGNELNFDCF